MKHAPFSTLLLAAVAIVLGLWPGMSEALQFDRVAIARGEVWRFATGHFTHFTTEHLIWDALLFIVLGAVLENHSRRAFLLCVGFSVAAISAVLWLFQPQLRIYRGLSGVDSAFFVNVCIHLISTDDREAKRWVIGSVVVGLAALAAKITAEAILGRTLFVASSGVFRPLPVAHLIGAACGFCEPGLYLLTPPRKATAEG